MPSLLETPPPLLLRALRRDRDEDAEIGRARAAEDFATASKAEVPSGDKRFAAAPATLPSSSSALPPPSSEVADDREGGGMAARSGVPITDTCAAARRRSRRPWWGVMYWPVLGSGSGPPSPCGAPPVRLIRRLVVEVTPLAEASEAWSAD